MDLRRHDYTVDILGGATGLNHASDYRDVDDILQPPILWTGCDPVINREDEWLVVSPE